jgi:hypothetical protein
MFSQVLFSSSSTFKFSKDANLFVISIWYFFLTSSSFSFLRLNLSPSNFCAACLLTANLCLSLPSWPHYTVWPSHQVCHTKLQLRYPRAHTTGAPDTGHRTYSGSHKRATTNRLILHIAIPTTQATHTNKRNNPHKDSAIQEDKRDHPHTATQRTLPASPHITRNLRFLQSQKFLHKRPAPHTGLPEETIKIQNTTRPANPEEATQSSTTSSRIPIQPPQHPKRGVQPGTPQIHSVSFYV